MHIIDIVAESCPVKQVDKRDIIWILGMICSPRAVFVPEGTKYCTWAPNDPWNPVDIRYKFYGSSLPARILQALQLGR